jgi:hypothetical protein
MAFATLAPATIVLAGCNCGGKFDVKSGKAAPDPFSFAAALAKTTGARVIASVGGSDQSKGGADLTKDNSPNGGWFVFDNDSPSGRALDDGSNCSKGTCKTMQPEKYMKK